MSYTEETTRGIYITTNQTCNLSCIYCYEKDKSLVDTFDVEEAKRTLMCNLSNKTKKGTLINFHGGEPFLAFEKIKELCEWAWSQNFPERFVMFATSNGTLIHGEIQEWLFANRTRFVVGLSLDGTRDMHNVNRSNSFDKIDLNFFINTWPSQGVKMTVSPLTIGKLSDGIIYMHERGFKDIRANLAEMIDWSDCQYISIYRRELQKLAAYYESHPEIERCSIFNIHFSSVIKPEIRKWCGAGTEMEAIDVDGRRYPCHLFFESVCGKEKSEQCKKIDFSNPEEYTSPHCRDCKLLPLCPTCYGSNYISRGQIGLRDLSMCELTKIRISEVAKFEYNRIVNDTTKISELSNEEKFKRMRILEGIEKIADALYL